MTLPWGVKDFIDPANANEYKTYIESIKETQLELPSGNTANIIKADVKERKGNFLLILRYQLESWTL